MPTSHDIMTVKTSASKYQPAYEGAKFDSSGYCLKHPMIRLCKPASSLHNVTDAQAMYKIVRKCCPMCGEHSLTNERKLRTVSLGNQRVLS